MSQRRQFIQHNAKTIIYLDHTNLEGPDYVKAIRESERTAVEADIGNRLILVDSTGSVVDREVLQALKSLNATVSDLTEKTAVIGISGIQMLFMRTVAKFTKSKIQPFPDKESALNWLTESEDQ